MIERLGRWALGASSALGALCLLLAAVCLVFDLRPVIFRSGSMEPAISTGSVALSQVRPAMELESDDVVTVTTANGNQVTHRVVSAIPSAGSNVMLTLQGDANDSPDAESYVVSSAPVVLVSVPWLGYVFGWLQSGPGLVLVGGYLVLLLLVLTGRTGGSSGPGSGGRRRGSRRAARTHGNAGRRRAEPARHSGRRSMAVRLGVAVGALSMVGTSTAYAAPWTDPVSIDGTILSTYKVPVPTNVKCGSNVLGLTVSWDAVVNATSYTVTYNGTGSPRTVTGNSTQLAGLLGGGTATVVANRAFQSTVWTSAASASVSYAFVVVAVCT